MTCRDEAILLTTGSTDYEIAGREQKFCRRWLHFFKRVYAPFRAVWRRYPPVLVDCFRVDGTEGRRNDKVEKIFGR